MIFWDVVWCNIALYVFGLYQVFENILENVSSLFKIQVWAREPCIDLTGKVALVTGANRGIGKHIAKELATRGCHVLLACRNTVEAAKIAQEIIPGQSSIVNLDLSTFESVLTCSRQLKDREIDFIVCNAGIMALPDCNRTKDGFEMQMQVNCLSHLLFVHSLLQQGSVRNSSDSRIVFLSSFASYGSSISTFEDLMAGLTCKNVGYHPKLQYGNSKLLAVLIASDLQDAIQSDYSSNATIFSINPGVVDTDLARNFCRNEFPSWIKPCTDFVLDTLFHLTLRRPERAARGLLRALTMPPDDVAGRYLSIRPSGRVVAKSSLAFTRHFKTERIFKKLVRKIE